MEVETMDQNDRLNALEVALKNEAREREFYLLQAERTSNPLGKAMFKEIADDEREHYERLTKLHEAWEKEGQWPETVPLEIKRTNVRDVLTQFVSNAAQLPAGDADDLKAVRTAIDFEARGVEFYGRLRDGVADRREKKFFDLLVSIENEHYLSLKETEEFLTDPASWYLVKERHTLDGA